MPNKYYHASKQLDQMAAYCQGRCEQFIDDYARANALSTTSLIRRVVARLVNGTGTQGNLEDGPRRRMGRPPGSKNKKSKAFEYNNKLVQTLEKAHAAQQQETRKKEK